MFIKKFIKKAYISFYKDINYKFLCEIKKNKKILSIEKEEFDTKEELNKKIDSIFEDYTQVYISTIIDSINQGSLPSCSKSEYKKREVALENIKYICLKNKYSFYVSLYDLMNIKKEYPFEIDFLYSLFAPIDFFAKKRNNYFYVLILKEKIAILGYKNEIPIFYDITEFNNENENNDEIGEIEEDNEDLLEDIDLDIDEIDDISDNIEEEAKSLDIEEPPTELKLVSTENQIIKAIQSSIKEYYNNYSDDFLEKIIFLDTINIGNDIKKLVEDELLLDSEIINFDLNKILNNLSEMENV